MSIFKILRDSFLVIILSFLLLSDIYANPTTTFYPTNVVDLGGNRSWTNVANLSGDTTGTSTNISLPRNQSSNQLLINNLGIDSSVLPSDAQINGIQVLIEWQASSGNMTDETIQLTKDGVNTVGVNRARGVGGPNTKTITGYGSPTDLWGTTWTPTDIYSNNFGAIINYTNGGWWFGGTQDADLFRVGFIIDYTPNYNPGGTSSNISLWFKTNEGTSTSLDGGGLSTWYDQSGNAKNADSVVDPTFLNNSNDNLNFYPLVNFDGSQYLEGTSNGGYSNSYVSVIVPNNDVNGTISGQVPFGLNCNTGILSSGTCGLPFSGLTLGAFTVAIADEVITHAIGSSTNWRSSQVGNANYSANKPMLLTVNSNDLSQTTSIYEKGIQLDNFTSNSYQTLENADFTIGRSSDVNNPFPYDGKIAEIINFSDSLSIIDKQKIESYLAIKYGITLSNGDIDYLDSLGNTVYDSTLNTNFNNDIFAIARDDISGLGQVESKSVNDSGIVTVRGQSQGTNLNPSFSSIDDLEYLFISNNNSSNTWVDYPGLSGYDLLDRNWIVQETGDTGLIDINFDVNNAFFDIPNLNSGSNYYFIYDSNNDGLFSDETPISMNNLGSDTWGVQGINLGDGNIFTLATESSPNNIPTDIILSDNTIEENNNIGDNIGTLSTSDLDLGDTHIYSLVSGNGDDDNSFFSISGNNLIIDESSDYEIKPKYNIRLQTDDLNGGVYQKQFQINILNTAESINSIIDFETPGKYSVVSGVWNRDGNDVFEGSFSLESGNVGQANTQTCFEVENTFQGIGTIDFKYRVSSQSGGDFLRFYIDNVEQQSWSGDIPWSTYNKNDISSGTHTYKWCYIKDGFTNSLDDKAYVDYITFYDTFPDNDSPNIDNTNFINNSLLPGGNHDIIIDYSDIGTGINSDSAVLKLYKWDGSTWGPNISSSYTNTNSITNFQANYSIVDLEYGRYMYEFEIRDNYGNNTLINLEFYIDKPEFYVNTGSYLSKLGENYSADEIVVTVKTVGAAFDVEIFKQDDFDDNRGNIIFDWNGSRGVGYDMSPYSSINSIPDNPILGSEIKNINTDGNLNEYTYVFKIGALIPDEQAAGNYSMNLGFNLILDY